MTPTACIVCFTTVTSETSAGHYVLDQPNEAGYANMSTHGIVREGRTFTLKLVARYTSVRNAASRNLSRSTTCTILGTTPIVHSQCKTSKLWMKGTMSGYSERARNQGEGREITEFLSIDGWCQRVQLVGPKRGHEIRAIMRWKYFR